MNTELSRLINRTELAAKRADKDGFVETAQALRGIASTLMKTEMETNMRLRIPQYTH